MPKFLLLLLMIVSISVNADVHCTQCKKKISGQYLLSKNKKPYCSKRCFSSTLPKCSVCKNAITGRYKSANNKVFCSDKCFSSILPKCTLCTSALTKAFKVDDSHYCEKCIKFDRCFSCKHPIQKGVIYRDKRKYCLDCKESSVFSDDEAQKIYQQAIKEHKWLLGANGVKIPPLKFVDLNVMKEFNHHHDENGMSLRGFYQETKVERETLDSRNRVIDRSVKKTGEMIYILNGLSKEEVMVTAIHELTHDWLSDYYKGIKVAPLWIEEGFCQYVAYNYCIDKKYTKLAEKIKNAPDQVYGKGAKFYLEKFGP